MDELPVQLGHELRVVEHDLGDEGARLEVAAPLEFEEVALRADDRPLLEPLEESVHGRGPYSSGCSGGNLGGRLLQLP